MKWNNKPGPGVSISDSGLLPRMCSTRCRRPQYLPGRWGRFTDHLVELGLKAKSNTQWLSQRDVPAAHIPTNVI
jgi:hypothetical protein